MNLDIPSFLIGMLNGSKSGGNTPASSPWTKLAEQDFTVNTSSTSATDVGTISCGAAAWTKAKMVYIRVRDKAGKRNGYFYGADQFFTNPMTAESQYTSLFQVIRVGTDGVFGLSNSMCGIYTYYIDNAGTVHISSKYNSNNSKTINGTYHVEVYTLEWPDNVSPFT